MCQKRREKFPILFLVLHTLACGVAKGSRCFSFKSLGLVLSSSAVRKPSKDGETIQSRVLERGE